MNQDSSQNAAACPLEGPSHENRERDDTDHEKRKRHIVLRCAGKDERRQMPHAPDNAEDDASRKCVPTLEQSPKCESPPSPLFSEWSRISQKRSEDGRNNAPCSAGADCS